ncbi:MAG: lysyl oxidase family protein [Planctomycetota bacterium]|jgi:hypothetical protein|nr:lysyl oxidase family protein [Planctomycetota bacterium]
MSIGSITALAAPAISGAMNAASFPAEDSLPEHAPASPDSVQLSDEAQQMAEPYDDTPAVTAPETDTSSFSDDPVEVSVAGQEMLDASANSETETPAEAVLNPDEIQSITVFNGEPESTADRHALFQPLRPLSELPIFSAFSTPSLGPAHGAVEHDHGEEPPHHDHEHDPAATAAINEHTQLPDLVPWTPYTQNARVVQDRESGKKLLSFGTTITNKGRGAMELDIGGTKEDERRPAFQLIQNDDGTEARIPVGEFYWHDAPGHNHYHFDEFALYRLREIGEDGQPGGIAAEGHKAGFCLMDSIQSHPDTPNSSVVPHFRGTSCAEGKKMGISPGWADHYPARQGLQLLDGQFIEIDDVEPGEYYLEIMTDPINRLVETNQENNDAFVKVKID